MKESADVFNRQLGLMYSLCGAGGGDSLKECVERGGDAIKKRDIEKIKEGLSMAVKIASNYTIMSWERTKSKHENAIETDIRQEMEKL